MPINVIYEDAPEDTTEGALPVSRDPRGTRVPGIIPSSLDPQLNELIDQTQAGLRKDFPGIGFGVPAAPARTDEAKGGTPSLAATPEPDEKPITITLGGREKPAEAAPPPAPPEDKPGQFGATLRAVGERAVGVATNIAADPANTIADLLPDWMDQGLVIDKSGIRWEQGKAYRDASAAKKLSNYGDNVDFGGSKNLISTDEIESDWNSGNKLSAAGKTFAFAAEQGIVSVPDMVAILSSMPVYTLGASADYAMERARNDGREQVNPADAMWGAATGLIVSALERYGAENVFNKIKSLGKTRAAKWFKGILTEAVTESIQNPVEFAGTRVDTAKQSEVTPGRLAKESAWGAVGGAGGGATVGGAVQLADALANRQPAQPAQPATPVAPGAPPPAAPAAGPAAPGTPPGTPPAAPGAAPTAIPDAAPSPGVYRPQGPNGPQVPVSVLRVAGDQAYVVALDENGEMNLDAEGEPRMIPVPAMDVEIYRAPPAAATPTPTAPPAAPTAPPAAPTAPPAAPTAPPAAPTAPLTAAAADAAAPTSPDGVVDTPTAEPLKDITAQLADMRDPATPRRAVFLSLDNVRRLKAAKLLDQVLSQGVAVKNFDWGGGLMIFPDQVTADAAANARKGLSGQQMQSFIGTLTSAAVLSGNKPAGPAAVVQQKDATGGVARETLVPPEQAGDAAAALAAEGKDVVVTTPEAGLARREAEIAIEQAAAAARGTKPVATTPPGKATEPTTPAPKPPKQDISLYGQFKRAMEFLNTSEEAAKTGAKDKIKKPDRVRDIASVGLVLQKLLREGIDINRAQQEGKADAVRRARQLVQRALALNEKDESSQQVEKGQGDVTNERLTEIANGIREVMRDLEPYIKKLSKEGGNNKKPVKEAEAADAAAAIAEEPDVITQQQEVEAKAKAEAEAEAAKMRAYEEAQRKQRESAAAPPPVAEAPAAESPPVTRKKKKVVVVSGLRSQAKTAEEIEADTAPEREVIPVESVKLTGASVSAMLSGLNYDVDGLAAKAGKKNSPMADAIRELLPDFNREGSWIGYLAGLNQAMRDNATFNKRIGILLERFITVPDGEVAEARTALIEFLQNIDGKRVDAPVIDAMLQYAQFSRAYRQLDAMTEELAKKDFFSDADPEDVAYNGELEAGEDTTPDTSDYEDRLRDSDTLFSRRVEQSTPLSIRRKLRRGWDIATVVMNVKGLWNSIHTRHVDSNTPVSSHQLLDEIMRDLPVNADTEYLRTFLKMLRRKMPDLPVIFETTLTERRAGNAGRQFSAAGFIDPAMHTIHVAVNRAKADDAAYQRDVLETIVHEMIHAATIYELNGHPNGVAAREFREVYESALQMAYKTFGQKRVDDSIAYAKNELKEAPEGLIDGIYGFTNVFEFATEVFTNPTFQSFLVDLASRNEKAAPGRMPGLFTRMIRAVARLLGFVNPQHQWLLLDAMAKSQQVMASQQARAIRAQGTLARYAKRLKAVIDAHPNPGPASNLTFDELVASIARTLPDGHPASVAAIYRAGSSELSKGTPTIERDTAPVLRQTLAEKLLSVRVPDSDIREEPTLRERAGSAAVDLWRKGKGFWKSELGEALRNGSMALWTFDQIERRKARFFGSPDDAANPLRRYMDVRRRRLTAANVLLEKAENDVNGEWLKLSATESRNLGQLMIDTTLWQIDPSKPKDKQPAKSQKRKGFDARYDKLRAAWNQMSDQQQKVYKAARDYNEHAFAKLRRAAIDMALYGFSDRDISPLERTLLYSARTVDDVRALVGFRKKIDLGVHNDSFLNTIEDVMRVTQVEGPYFTLRRYGDYVVTAAQEGERTFATEEQAQAWAQYVRDMTPKNKARVRAEGGQHVVKFKADYVAFHRSREAAEADQLALEKAGLWDPKASAITKKQTSVSAGALSAGLQEMIDRAGKRMPSIVDPNTGKNLRDTIKDNLQNALMTIMAERAAVASQLRRENVAGVKPEEMHMGFAERTHAFAWHYANLVTSKDEVFSLSRLREYGRDRELNDATQDMMYERGETIAEVEKRIREEIQNYDPGSRIDGVIANLGFATYLASPSYTFINSMQNFTVAIPVIGARYGYGRTSRAFARAMRVVAGPAFMNAIRGTLSKPGSVVSYDIYKAVADAVAGDPRFSKWTEGKNSPFQQLVDLGVINASFTQELVAVAHRQSRTTRKGMEWLRLMPQAAEMLNRISTSLAMLELTNGDVTKTADMVRQTQIDYALANQPRLFRVLGRIPGLRSVAMFKMYPQAIYNLFISSVYDLRREGVMSRAEAAKVLGGLVASHTLAAGVMGGLLVEPLRMLLFAINQMFGDEDEPYDVDTAVRMWAADTFGEWWGGVVSKGLPNAIGLDLSNRMGLAHLLARDAPNLSSYRESAKWVFETVGGPAMGHLVKGATGFYGHWKRGEYTQAAGAVVPLKILQDALKAWGLVSEGAKTASGNTLVAPEEANAWDVGMQAAGFTPRKVADMQDKRSTKFTYEQWAQGRRIELIRAWREADGAARGEALADIREWNSKNPGQKILGKHILGSVKRNRMEEIELREGKVKDPALRERLAY